MVFILSSRLFVRTPPHGSAIIDAARIATITIKEGGFKKAKLSALGAQGTLSRRHFAQFPNYTDRSIKEVQMGITACKVRSTPAYDRTRLTHLQFFLFLPLYFVCWIQIWNNLISQAGDMALHGTPNDLLQNLDPIALIIFTSLLDCEYKKRRHLYR